MKWIEIEKKQKKKEIVGGKWKLNIKFLLNWDKDMIN